MKRKIILSFILLAALIVILNLKIIGKTGIKRDANPQRISKSIQNGHTVLAAGDIGDCWSKNTAATETAKLLDKLPGTILTLGDNVQIKGAKEEFDTCFDPTWGRHKDRIFPSIGNHDYTGYTSKNAYYYKCFGKRAGEPGKGYYSFNLGNWHLIAVDTNILITPCSLNRDACKRRFEHLEWLKKDLEQNKTDCTLIYGHHPRFTSQIESNIPDELTPLWELAYLENVDLILTGHIHNYERFAPQNPKGELDSKRGIRQFIVGTGGGVPWGHKDIAKNIEVINHNKFGVLKLVLGKGEYEWEFISTDGSFVDKGKSTCH